MPRKLCGLLGAWCIWGSLTLLVIVVLRNNVLPPFVKASMVELSLFLFLPHHKRHYCYYYVLLFRFDQLLRHNLPALLGSDDINMVVNATIVAIFCLLSRLMVQSQPRASKAMAAVASVFHSHCASWLLFLQSAGVGADKALTIYAYSSRIITGPMSHPVSPLWRSPIFPFVFLTNNNTRKNQTAGSCLL